MYAHTVLGRITMTMTEHLAYDFTLLFIEGSQARNSIQQGRILKAGANERLWRGADYWLAPHGLLRLPS